jgi:hypothetical protein
VKSALILCLKDLYLNRSGIAGAWTVTGLFIAMASTMKPPSNVTVAFRLACGVTMIACMPVAEWLVYRE